MPTQVEYPFLGLASGSTDGAVAHWLGTLRAAVEARDVVEYRRVLHNVDDGAQGSFDDMEILSGMGRAGALVATGLMV